ncbi:MAG: hypothetical protein ACLUKN_13095 [Bacilli bacterium]
MKNNRHRHRRHKVRGNPWISSEKDEISIASKKVSTPKPANGGGAF